MLFRSVVPELASRDHIRRILPLARQALSQSGLAPADLDGIAWTEGPGLAGALLVGAGVGAALAWALGRPGIGVHHLEGHLLSPLLASDQPPMPFTALLVSGGHTQLLAVEAIGRYRLLGDTLDDAAGELVGADAAASGVRAEPVECRGHHDTGTEVAGARVLHLLAQLLLREQHELQQLLLVGLVEIGRAHV